MAVKGAYDNVLNDFIYDLPRTGFVAAAGGGQAAATQLNAQICRVDTVVTRGDSVKLPAAIAGLEIDIINNTAIGMQVFGLGTDTINGLAANVGVYQPPFSSDTYWCAGTGVWHAEVGFGYSGGLGTETAQDGIVAFAGGGQTNATPITVQMARLTTVATIGDSIKLPPSAPGLEITVINHGANAVQVFGSGTDIINDSPTAVGVSQMTYSSVLFFCTTAGLWYSEGLASGFGGPGLQTQSFTNGLTATGTNQATALPLSNMMSRVTTTAVGTGVLLPVSIPGLSVTITNRGANPLTIYGNGTDVVNSVAFVVMPSNATGTFVTAVAGNWECESVGAGFSGNLPTVSTTNGITATPAGTQATAVQLTTVINRATTVATAGDAVRLPACIAGLQITIYNAGAASLNVFPNTGDSINGAAANTAFALAAGKNATFGSPVNGSYHAIVSA